MRTWFHTKLLFSFFGTNHTKIHIYHWPIIVLWRQILTLHRRKVSRIAPYRNSCSLTWTTATAEKSDRLYGFKNISKQSEKDFVYQRHVIPLNKWSSRLKHWFMSWHDYAVLMKGFTERRSFPLFMIGISFQYRLESFYEF